MGIPIVPDGSRRALTQSFFLIVFAVSERKIQYITFTKPIVLRLIKTVCEWVKTNMEASLHDPVD